MITALLEIVPDSFGFQTEHADDLKSPHAKIDIKGRVLALRGFLRWLGIKWRQVLEDIVAHRFYLRTG